VLGACAGADIHGGMTLSALRVVVVGAAGFFNADSVLGLEMFAGGVDTSSALVVDVVDESGFFNADSVLGFGAGGAGGVGTLSALVLVVEGVGSVA